MGLKTRMAYATLAIGLLGPLEARGQCILENPQVNNRNLLVGADFNWGGAIRTILPKRTCTNIVNNGNPDPGRQIQVAFRRGEAPPVPQCWVCSPGCNDVWNPTQAGSPCPENSGGHPSGVITSSITSTEIHSLTQPYCFDDDDGRSNLFLDQSITLPKGNTIRVAYSMNSQEPLTFSDCQEFPVAYLQPSLDSAFRYSGGAPWTAAPAEAVSVPVGNTPTFTTSEPWIAWVASTDGYGLGMYIPTGQPHDVYVFIKNYDTPSHTHGLQNIACFTTTFNSTTTQTAYFIYGTVDQIRSVVYEYEGYSWFQDVRPTYVAYEPWINKIFRNNITTGCGGSNYCPGTSIPREQMAVFLVTAKNGPGYNPPACSGTQPFTDVPNNHLFCKWIKAAKEQGIMLGGSNENCTLGNTYFCPSGAVTRAHMAAFLLRAKEGPSYNPPACGVPMFGDVPAGHFYCRWIEEIARRGITGGCGGGNYCPTDANTRAQMAVFMSVNWALQ